MEILQGTTPSFTISIDPNDFALANAIQLELAFKQFNQPILIKHLADCVVDTDANTVTYHFQQEETLAFLPKTPLSWQLRLLTASGDVIGTVISQIKIDDLISQEVLS